jgi:hypothetical protein
VSTSAVLIAVGAFVAVVAALRSTWSPCGASMLSTITPLAERARAHRYATTTAWFVAGAVVGGACLGLLMMGVALGIHASSWSDSLRLVLALTAALATAASDLRLGGFQFPVHHRQVNERWLDQFRPWVYGAGFGWQIGTGLATYVRTAAVYLTIVTAALTGSPRAALALGVLFGLVRGLAVFLGRRITTAQALARFHQRFAELDAPSVAAVGAAQVVAAAFVAWWLSPWLTTVVLAAGLLVLSLRRRASAHPRQATPPAASLNQSA